MLERERGRGMAWKERGRDGMRQCISGTNVLRQLHERSGSRRNGEERYAF